VRGPGVTTGSSGMLGSTGFSFEQEIIKIKKRREKSDINNLESVLIH
jgi:hypothetical protein